MDLISDMLSRLQNAINVQKETVDIPHSNMKDKLAQIFLAEGYISKIEAHTRMNKKYLRLTLKYIGKKKNIISGIKRVSTPGKRIYVGAGRIPRVRSGYGTAVLSTPQGLMTGEQAGTNRIGGEVICYVW
jgi:small subunit ribosomal protein S8